MGVGGVNACVISRLWESEEAAEGAPRRVLDENPPDPSLISSKFSYDSLSPSDQRSDRRGWSFRNVRAACNALGFLDQSGRRPPLSQPQSIANQLPFHQLDGLGRIDSLRAHSRALTGEMAAPGTGFAGQDFLPNLEAVISGVAVVALCLG